jgi:iron complex transport system permease protein
MFAPLELPCGIITAAIGAPYFVYLLIKNRQP